MGHSAAGNGGVSLWAYPSHQAQWQRSRGYTRPMQSKFIRTTTRPNVNWVKKAIVSSNDSAMTDASSSDSAEEAQATTKGLVSDVKIVSEPQIAKVAAEQVSQIVDAEVLVETKVESNVPEKESCAMEGVEEVPFTGEDFISGLGLTLEGWVAMGNTLPQKLSQFHSVRAPPLGIKDYLKRIHQYFQCSDECYVIALVIIDRAGKADKSLTLCSLNVHRLLVSAVMLGAKFHDDVYYSNGYYAKVGGLAMKEMNELEARLLKLLNWKVNVTSDEYREYLRIVSEATRPQTCVRSPLKEPEPEPCQRT